MGRILMVAAALLAALTLAGCTRIQGSPTAPPSVAPAMSPAEAAASAVRDSMQHKLDTDSDLSKLNLTVVDVVLVKKVGNEYTGIATVQTSSGKSHDVSVDVTADGDNVIWESEPGAFLFALTDPAPGGPPPAAVPPASSNGPLTLQPSRQGMVYIVTKSGKTACQMSDSEVDCQSSFTNTPLINGYPANGVKFRSNGAFEWVSGDLGDIPVVTIGYNTYRALSWTIDANSGGTTFTHSGTGRSIFVSVDTVKIN